MARAWSRQAGAALAAVAGVGWLTLATPLHAQAAAGSDTRVLLSTTPTAELGGGVRGSNLNAFITYLIDDADTARPAGIVLVHPNAAEVKPGGLEALAERFLRVYHLEGYRMSAAKDGSAAFLIREDTLAPAGNPGRLAMLSLVRGEGIAPAVRWLNEIFGGSPQRVERTRLVWSKMVNCGREMSLMEASLNLVQGAPCYVDIYLPGAKPAGVAAILSEHLNLSLKTVADNRAGLLRQQLGEKPLGYMTGDKSHGGIALVRAGGQKGRYRLGGVKPLAELRAQRGKEAGSTLPELPRTYWPDEISRSVAGAGEATTPDTKPVAPAPPAKPAMPSPAEARAAYARQLQAL